MPAQSDFYHLLLAANEATKFETAQAIDVALKHTAAGAELHGWIDQYNQGLITFGECLISIQETLRKALGY